jgi:hypothetical protein
LGEKITAENQNKIEDSFKKEKEANDAKKYIPFS